MARRKPKTVSRPYSFSAEYYDSFGEYIDYNQIADYVEQLFFDEKKSVKEILDIGCGTGTIDILMAQKSYNVCGIDNSPEMISVARNKNKESNTMVQFKTMDALEILKLNRNFDLVMAMSDVVNHILERNKLVDIFKSANQVLNPGGVFIFDINTPYELQHVMSCVQEAEIEDIIYKWEGSFDKKSLIGTYVQSFYDKNGDELAREIHKERAYKSRDIINWLKQAGFHKIKHYIAFTREKPLTPDVERIYFIAEKK